MTNLDKLRIILDTFQTKWNNELVTELDDTIRSCLNDTDSLEITDILNEKKVVHVDGVVLNKLRYLTIKNNSTDLKNLLLDSKCFCAHNGRLYDYIPADIYKYLCDNDFEGYAFKMFSDKRYLEFTLGDSVELYTTYFKNFSRINNAKHLVIEDSKYDINSDMFVMRYLRDKVAGYDYNDWYHGDFYDAAILDSIYEYRYNQLMNGAKNSNLKLSEQEEKRRYPANTNNIILYASKSNDISYSDLIDKLHNGVEIEQAIELGIRDKEKYGLYYIGSTPGNIKVNCDKQYDFICNIVRQVIKEQS